MNAETKTSQTITSEPLQVSQARFVLAQSDEQFRDEHNKNPLKGLFGEPTDDYIKIIREAARHVVSAYELGFPLDSREWNHEMRVKIIQKKAV